jgi:hypothetical protein
MSRLPAKVLIVDRLGNQYLITVQVSEKYPCTFDGLSFGENKPHFGSYRDGWLDLVYHQNPGLQEGQSSDHSEFRVGNLKRSVWTRLRLAAA